MISGWLQAVIKARVPAYLRANGLRSKGRPSSRRPALQLRHPTAERSLPLWLRQKRARSPVRHPGTADPFGTYMINELLSLAKQANKHFSLSLKAKGVALPVSWATWLCTQGRSELCSWVSSFGSRAQQALRGSRRCEAPVHNKAGAWSPSGGSLLRRGVLRNPHASGWISRGLRWLSKLAQQAKACGAAVRLLQLFQRKICSKRTRRGKA